MAQRQKKMNKKLAITLIIAITVVALASVLITVFSPQGTPTSGKVLINEVMAGNKSAVVDDNGQYSDWIELYNPGTSAISLSGWGLSDSKTVPVKWAFPDISLEPGQYLLIYCSKQDKRNAGAPLHTNFGLSSTGESVVLTDNIGNIVDYITFDTMAPDTSLGRDPQDINQWRDFERVTPGYANTDEGHSAYMSSLKVEGTTLRISEVMSTNVTTLTDDYDEAPDWVELYNGGNEAIHLKGYGLSDKPNKIMKWTFPDVTIQPGQYLVVYCSGKGDAQQTGDTTHLHSNFRISNYQETIVLASNKGQVLDTVDVPQLDADSSYALNVNTNTWDITTKATPGFANTDDGFAQFSQQQAAPKSSVQLNEAMLYNDKYAATGGKYYDWVELYNSGGETVNLKGWGLTDDTEKPLKWKFPDITLAPGEYRIIYCSGLNQSASLHTNFRLSSGGETLALVNASGEIMDHMSVGDVPSNMSFGRQNGAKGFFYFQAPSPGTANSGGAYGFAQMPTIETAAGSFRGAQQVTISTKEEGATIRYTTDGSTPTQNSKEYTGPITVSETTPLRARAFKVSLLGSKTATATYLIDAPHNLPIVSLVTDPSNLFDTNYGIYTIGTGTDDSGVNGANASYPGANFWNDWERDVHFEYIQQDGTLGVSLDGGVKIFGAYSRKMKQKSLSIFARARYGTDTINYPLFETRPYTQYKSIVLRTSGQDAEMTKIRDITITDLIREHTNVDVAAFRQSVLYINGQYWGVYNIREKINKYMIAQHHDIADPESIDLLVANSRALVGDSSDYKALIEYVQTHDITDPSVYAYVESKVDLQNFADWNIVQAWSNNADLGNIKYWRERSSDGKWRWVAYDFDWAFFHSNPQTLDGLARVTDERGMGAGRGISTVLLRTLLKNQTFKELFLQRYAYHLQNTFATDRVLAKIDMLSKNIEDEVARDRERWNTGTMDGWRNQLNKMISFVKVRNDYMIYFARKYFNLSESDTIARFGSVGVNPGASN